MKSIVVAYDRLGTIGKDNKLPWAGKLPADMRRFRELTEGTSVIMGRRTFESLPDSARPLPNRQNIVVSLSQQAFRGAEAATSLEDAFSKATHEAMIIGGATIYRQALPLVDRVYATRITAQVEGGDAFFPELSLEEWVPTDYQYIEQDAAMGGKNQYSCAFITYLRRNPLES
jgi:dihydrofolate reductase